MWGWQVHELGAPADVLTWGEMPDPEPGPGQVLVRVHAVACNFPDILLCQGRYQDKPAPPFTPGMEIAGEVVAAGEGAVAAVGDRVLGPPPMGRGGYAELTVLDADATLPWPDGMSAGQAAGMFVTYQTGICALEHRARLQAGETLLVHAAAGGVGSAAVQLGKALGARVIGTAGGPEKCAVARELGADEIVDYATEDLVARVKELTGGRGADVVYDPIGGDVFDASRQARRVRGPDPRDRLRGRSVRGGAHQPRADQELCGGGCALGALPPGGSRVDSPVAGQVERPLGGGQDRSVGGGGAAAAGGPRGVAAPRVARDDRESRACALVGR